MLIAVWFFLVCGLLVLRLRDPLDVDRKDFIYDTHWSCRLALRFCRVMFTFL
jgi:hypothetical protein